MGKWLRGGIKPIHEVQILEKSWLLVCWTTTLVFTRVGRYIPKCLSSKIVSATSKNGFSKTANGKIGYLFVSHIFNGLWWFLIASMNLSQYTLHSKMK